MPNFFSFRLGEPIKQKRETPDILPNTNRAEWRYVSIGTLLKGNKGYESVNGRLFWIPPYQPDDFRNEKWRGEKKDIDTQLDSKIFEHDWFSAPTWNPLVDLLAWWRWKDISVGKLGNQLGVGTIVVADMVCMAAFTGWLVVRLFPEGSKWRWLVFAGATGLVGLGHAIQIFLNWVNRRKSQLFGDKSQLFEVAVFDGFSEMRGERQG